MLYMKKDIPEEFKVLWKLSRKKDLHPELKRQLQVEIARIRSRYRRNLGIDRLREKLERYADKNGKTNGRWARDKINELARLIYEGKGAPEGIEGIGKWISVEIECILPNQKAEEDFVAFSRKQGYTKFLTIKHDGSIHPDNEDGVECECNNEYECECGSKQFGKEIVATFQYGDWSMITAVCEKLNQLGATVNKTCGLHVHFDMRHMTMRQVTTVGKRIARAIPALKQLLPKSRQENRFCGVDINRHTDNNDGEARYAFVNLLAYNRHKTIEIRGHSGTTDATKIINWIRVIKPLMVKPGKDAIATIPQLITEMRLESDLAEYVTKRAEKFAKVGRPLGDDVADDNNNTRVNFQMNTPIANVATNTPGFVTFDVETSRLRLHEAIDAAVWNIRRTVGLNSTQIVVDDVEQTA